ncbi:MAG: cytochrome c oxidase assembly protein [Thermoleophilia bacterium]|nr:cytochrome c oxidase assembly protein [Thermoleophilia bacterium]
MSGLALAGSVPIPVGELAFAWSPAPAVLAAAALALCLFAQGFVRLRRRGRADHARGWRAATFVTGMALLVLALVSPLDAIGEEYLLSAHMLQHVLIGDVAPALIVLSVSGPLLFFLLPRGALLSAARSRPVRAALAALVRPRVALAGWLAAVGAWHVPGTYEAALASPVLHDLEHATFVLAGLLLWYQLLDPARRGRLSRARRVGLAAVVFAAGQVLTMVLVFSFEPLYPAYAAAPERLLDLSALTDQRLAGIVMMVDQIATLGTFVALTLLAADGEQRAGAAPVVPGSRP